MCGVLSAGFPVNGWKKSTLLSSRQIPSRLALAFSRWLDFVFVSPYTSLELNLHDPIEEGFMSLLSNC
jgi:hypothetical protein